MVKVCPYCNKVVDPNDPDYMQINYTGMFCHGTCRKEAIENVIRRVGKDSRMGDHGHKDRV